MTIPVKLITVYATLIMLSGIICSNVYSETIVLKLPQYVDNSHQYYYELLEKSLDQIGVPLKIIPSEKPLPQKRAVAMFENRQLDAIWLIRSKERDALFVAVSVGLTNGLAGQRILFIPPGTQATYNGVKTLADFRDLKLTGAFGINWFDIKIWKHNVLNYHAVDGDWRKIYACVEKKMTHFDYFSRGINEIVAEADDYPNLAIEERLMLVYDRDFQLYLSAPAANHQPTIKKALLAARENGLIDSLIHKYWADIYTKIKPEDRIKIELELPYNH
jgi:hypothetical protein